MKILDISPLEFPIRLLKLIPIVGKYYGDVNDSPSAIGHFHTAFTATLIAAHFHSWLFLFVMWFLHYVVKEVLIDGWRKHWIKKLIGDVVPDHEMTGFYVDSIVRNAGFVFGLPLFFVG